MPPPAPFFFGWGVGIGSASLCILYPVAKMLGGILAALGLWSTKIMVPLESYVISRVASSSRNFSFCLCSSISSASRFLRSSSASFFRFSTERKWRRRMSSYSSSSRMGFGNFTGFGSSLVNKNNCSFGVVGDLPRRQLFAELFVLPLQFHLLGLTLLPLLLGL